MRKIATKNKKKINEYIINIIILIAVINKITKPETTTKTPTNNNNSNRINKKLGIVSENHCPNTVRPLTRSVTKNTMNFVQRPSSTLSPSGALVLRVWIQ